MTIAQLRAAIAAATNDEERNKLFEQLETALKAGDGGGPSELEQLRSQVTDLETRRDALRTEFTDISAAAVDDAGEPREFTIDEAERRGRILADRERVEADLTAREDQLRQKIEDDREQRMTDQVAQMRRSLGLADVAPNSVGGSIAVLNEARVYERGNGNSYLLDLVLAKSSLGQSMGARSAQAGERLQRHSHENHVLGLEAEDKIRGLDQDAREKAFRGSREGYFLRQMIEIHNERTLNRGSIGERALSYRALSTASTAGGEFTPPMFLTEQWIMYARPGRVLADLQHHEDLPDGTMSINIPKVTGGTSSATQGSQNTNVSMTDLQTAFVTFPVVTKAGAQIVSLQLLERSPINFDEVVGRDLALAYAQDLNYSIHSGTGTTQSGGTDIVGILNTSGINTVTWTQGSPTLKGLYGQAGYAKYLVATGRKLAATHRVIQSIEWEWIDQYFDSSNRPLVTPQYAGPFNAITVAPDDAVAQGTIGRRLQELDTFVDLTLPTNLGVGSNQTVDVVGRFDENYLYESPITTRMLPQTYGLQLSMLLQIYGYAAFTAARYPVANSAIVGTGLSTANMTFNS